MPVTDFSPPPQAKAISSTDAAANANPDLRYDVLGFGHPRIDDGDFDGTETIDIGAFEFGGLLGNGEVPVGGQIEVVQHGIPSALYGLFLGIPGAPLDLGPKGTLFLDPGVLLLLAVGTLSPGGEATVLSAIAPAAAVGFDLPLQAVQKGPGPSQGLHWTNLETLRVVTP